MARTPIARMLGRVAAEHQIAAELHITPEQVRLSRRNLLAGAAVVGAVAAVGGGLGWPRSARAAASQRIAIVGGGISGLAAALQLQDKGVAATAYEANSRVGGRMFSSTSGSYWDAGQVVSGGKTQTVVADHTILAVPLGVLKRLNFSAAGFDSMKTAQINNMGMSHNCKLQLQFGNRIWNGTGAWPGISSGEMYADTGYQNTRDVSRAQPGNQGILVDYTGGNVAAAFNPNAPFLTASSGQARSYAQSFLGQLEPVLPGISGQWNGKATMSAWHTNPYAWGAYSYRPNGYPHQYPGYEAVRQGNVHFAVNTARSTTRDTWRAAPRKGNGRPTRFSPTTSASRSGARIDPVPTGPQAVVDNGVGHGPAGHRDATNSSLHCRQMPGRPTAVAFAWAQVGHMRLVVEPRGNWRHEQGESRPRAAPSIHATELPTAQRHH